MRVEVYTSTQKKDGKSKKEKGKNKKASASVRHAEERPH